MGHQPKSVKSRIARIDNQQVYRALRCDIRGIVHIGQNRTVGLVQFSHQTGGLRRLFVNDQDTTAGSAKALYGCPADAVTTPALFAFAQFIDHDLQARQATHPRHQDQVIIWLAEEIVRSGLEATDTVFTAIKSRHQNHRNMTGCRIVFQTPASLEPVHHRHHNIQQDKIGLFGAGNLDSGRPVATGRHVKIFDCQLGFEQADIGIDIIDNENTRTHKGSP